MPMRVILEVVLVLFACLLVMPFILITFQTKTYEIYDIVTQL